MSKLIKPQVSHGESGILLGLWCHFDLPESTLKSIVEKYAAPTILFNASWIHGKGYKSFFVHALSLQKFMQKCSDPSFFLTSTTVLHHGDWLGCITPTSSISWSKVPTSSKSGGGMHLNHSLNGSLLVMQISCLIALVQAHFLPA